MPPKMASTIIIREMVMAFINWALGMVRWKTVTVLRPLAREEINSSSTSTVTVFRPPAVEPEEPPMIINTMATALPPSVSPP